MRLAVLVALVALALVLAAPAASAGEVGVETVELAYRAPKGCPNQDAFVAAVSKRTARASFVRHAAGARRFVVDIRPGAGAYAGRLIIEQGGDRAIREVTSARCEDLVDAFVFFTAIAIDPGAGAAPASPEAVPPPEPAPPPTTPAPAASPSLAEPPPPSAPQRPLIVSAPSPRPVWHLSAGSGGWVANGIGEVAMVAAHPVVDLGSSADGLAPSVRLGLAWANSPSQRSPEGKLTLGVRALILSACGFQLHLSGETGPSVRLCAVLEGGVLAVRPFALERPRSPERPWFAAGPLVRLEVPILPARLAIGGDAALAVPFERERVYSRSSPTVELVDQVGVRLSATLVARLF